MMFTRVLSTLAICLASLSTCSAAFVYNFDGDTPFDGAGAGTTMEPTDPAGSTAPILTSIDILAPEYDDNGAATGNTLSALAGDDVETNIQQNLGVGVNNPNSNSFFENTVGGPGSESRDFNLGEAWVIEFDADVLITEFNFGSIDDGDAFEVTVEGMGTPFTFGDTGSDDDFPNPFGTLVIPAGTNITFEATGTLDSASMRISEIELEVVPEPNSIAIAAFVLVGLALRRRQS